jgi:hypothetical protein
LLSPLVDDLLAPGEPDPMFAPNLSLLSRTPAWLFSGMDREPLLWKDHRLQLLLNLGTDPPSPTRFLWSLLSDLGGQRSSLLAGFSPVELELLITGSPGILEEMEGSDEIYNPLELRQLEAEFGARADSVLKLWERIPRRKLYALEARFIRDTLWYSYILFEERYRRPEQSPPVDLTDGFTFPDGSRADGQLLFAEAGEFGNVVVGGSGENTYTGNFLYLMDIGGNDRYRLNSSWPKSAAEIHNPGNGGDPVNCGAGWRCLIDMAGDDQYLGLENGALAGAFLGATLLVDQQGDDTYRAASFDLGCGWLGVGVLADRDGNDIYSGDTGVMGAAALGLGLLLDEAGTDLYRAHLYAQGFGYIAGIGILADRRGSDIYAAQPKYTDILRYEDHSLSLSQGFAIGARPDYSGGIGILHDAAGNDSYLADIYGQGSAYWYSLGLLLDENGNDRYDAYQYSQGAGIHLAVGYLLDQGGNDSYSAHGVGQGCGHDLAFGLLQDDSGNDRYSCDDLSQGAGSANGIGMLLDLTGQDGYLSKGATAPAYGNPRRNFGSVGLLADGAGQDYYSSPGGPGEKRGSLLGQLVDLPAELAGPVWDPGEAVAFRDSAYNWGDYFLLAGSGEPRFREWQQAGMDSLIANPDQAIPALIPFFDTKVARQRHRLKDIMQKIGEPAVDPLREVLAQGSLEYRGQALWCLEKIGSAAAFPEILRVLDAPRHLRDRIAALSALAGLGDLDDDQKTLLTDRCRTLAAEETHPLLLKAVAHLCRSQTIGSPELLIGLAQADHYAPRWVAKKALAMRKGWHDELTAAWQTAGPERILMLSELLPLCSAGVVKNRLKDLKRSDLWEKPEIRRAALRALLAHPDGGERILRSWRDKLLLEFPSLTPLR